jgi:hypothetical protein
VAVDTRRFSTLVSLVVGINQFTFGFGPSPVGVLRDRTGTYDLALGVCMALQATAAVLIVLGPGRRPSAAERGPRRRPLYATPPATKCFTQLYVPDIRSSRACDIVGSTGDT